MGNLIGMEDSSSDVTPLWAHSRNLSGRRHTLEDHLRGSAALARQFGAAFDAGELAEYLALVHDVGKGSCSWQHGLQVAEADSRRVGIPHKEAGAWLAASHAGRPFAAVVQGHHGGLPGYQDLQTLIDSVKARTHKEQPLVEEAIARVALVVPEIAPTGRVPLPRWLMGPSSPGALLARDLLLRMLFSCVVDADFLDTGAHFADLPVVLREDVDMAALAGVFEERRRRALAARRPSPVDDVRRRVYEQAVARATGGPGMYVLHVPTGGGKTFASAGFALHHAAAHGLRRVVVAVPYVSITQQNAQIYRDLLDPDDDALPLTVLEHHSSVDLDAPDSRRARTAAENWDAPFVVTTTVQLFESLYSHKPAAMRKLHRLAKSVIVLDEVQALPDHLLVPILSALRGLVERFGATVVLVSATQPDFWSLAQLHGLPRRRLIDDPSGLFTSLRRVTYDWRQGPHVTWESMAEEIAHRSGRQTLTVVNTTTDAARLHRLLEHQAPGPVLHLSTRMTAEHRRTTIALIRDMLDADQDVHVVSTQLIEAGVDLDFPRVLRAWAPAESLQQAAGRCNRDGRLVQGTVVVFHIHDAGQPRDNLYEAALKATAAHIGPGLAQPDDLDALNRYYQLRYTLHGSTPAAMGGDIDDLRTRLEFPAVDLAFRMINDEYSRPVVVVRDEADRDAIEADIAALRSPFPSGPEPLRRLQPHTASLPRHEAQAALADGLAEPVIGDLLLWNGAYHPDRGLDPAEKEDRTAFVV
ncbi:CRISPR-associated helicase Cas3' [Kitasatospora sp. NPDC127116]|uniref:CRISPR-associated helicase Cas3' n=1 Tax=Kitasatospora sp. NPDC127116 TaxID=3345367 RepID=UPI0036262E9D